LDIEEWHGIERFEECPLDEWVGICRKRIKRSEDVLSKRGGFSCGVVGFFQGGEG
jgi:hypothetical protein